MGVNLLDLPWTTDQPRLGSGRRVIESPKIPSLYDAGGIADKLVAAAGADSDSVAAEAIITAVASAYRVVVGAPFR